MSPPANNDIRLVGFRTHVRDLTEELAGSICDPARDALPEETYRACYHGHTKRIAGAVEQALVGRPLLQEVTP